jgi:thioredoxin reductase/bacterioferritin-associated ferredoxin
MKNSYDAIIIGAGPAGLACSAELADKGLGVAVLDEQAGPGGQIYRNITRASSKQQAVLGADYSDGLGVVKAFEEAALDYLPRARVWQADPAGDVYLSHDGCSEKLSAEYLVLSTGAMERPVPFPGWTLPGVMTCGGMSNLYKDSGLTPAEPVVMAGSGPLLWLIAEHLFALDAPIAAILDTTPIKQMLPAMKHLVGAMKRYDYMMKGVKMIAAVHRTAMKKKVPVYRSVKNLRAHGEDRLQQVKASCKGRELNFDATTLLVHEGIIPNTALLRQVGCQHAWDPVQRYWHPAVRSDGGTNLPSVFVAGDGNFVHGAKSAELKGRLTAMRIAWEMHRLSKSEYEQQANSVRQELHRELLPRPFIDALYTPREELYTIPDDALVCRCEGVLAGRIRELVGQGFSDHNEIKSIIRCGMGPCQGRMCGPAVLELVAEVSGIPTVETRQLRVRPPIKPVSLQELANAKLGETDES